MTQTFLIFDVDGVFNSLSGRPPKRMAGWLGDWAEQRVSTLEGASWRILWAKELVTAVNGLTALENVTPIWLTTWQDSAPAFIAPALHIEGAEDWEVLHAVGPDGMDLHSVHDWWKLDVLQDFMAQHPESNFVWIDDDIKYSTTAIKWMRETIGADRGLMVSPSSYIGVTKQDIDDIMEFISK